MRFSVIIAIALLLSACSQPADPYEENMRSGKDALIKGDYEEASSFFEIALIEKPQDSDAKILLDQSREGYTKEKTKRVIKEYVNSINETVEGFKQILTYYTSDMDKDAIVSIKDLENIEKIEVYQKEALSIIDKFENDNLLYEINSKLLSSMDSLISDIKGEGRAFDSKFKYLQAVSHLNLFQLDISELAD